MKTLKMIGWMLVLGAGAAFGHAGVELGPNKGRIIELSDNETLHGEVVAKDGKLHIAILDKDMKPVVVKDQTLIATAGTRQKPVKLEVEKAGEGFTVQEPGAGEWLIVQFKGAEDAKAITARMKYDTSICEGCDAMEWVCECQ